MTNNGYSFASTLAKPLKTLYVSTHRDELRQIKEERDPLQQDALRVQVQGLLGRCR